MCPRAGGSRPDYGKDFLGTEDESGLWLQDGREYQATSHFLYTQMLYGFSVQGCWGQGGCVCGGSVDDKDWFQRVSSESLLENR